MHRPSRQSEVLAIIEKHGPITTGAIAEKMRLSRNGVAHYIQSMAGEVHIGAWQTGWTKQGKSFQSAMWVAGRGADAPSPKLESAVARVPIEVDLAAMPFRSIFVGGVSPWAAV